MLSKCCDECSLELESDESNTETKLFRCFPARLSIRISKLFSCLKRKSLSHKITNPLTFWEQEATTTPSSTTKTTTRINNNYHYYF
jgi:hypothetical protein